MYNALKRIVALSAALLVLSPAPALAEAPMAKTQVPGYYRMMLGQFEITALYDGAVELDTKLLKNTNPEDLNRMLARMFVGNPKMQTAVNAYLINTGGNLILVDTGAAKLFGPTLGFVVDNLKAAGYDPAQVDTVILTHLHPDHVGGLGDPASPPVFPNANVYVSVLDDDFWMSQEAGAAATPEMQSFFKMARETAAPYKARGKWRTFADGTEIAGGVRAVKAYGHTPGHSAISVESGGQKLLIWGDLVHAHAIQFSQPGVSIDFDFDQNQAIATRRSLMYSMAASKTLVAGMHLPFPGIGRVRADGKGIYAWVPVEYAPLPKPAQ